MMNRTLLAAVSCSMLLSLSVAFAGGDKPALQPFDGPAIPVQPERIAKVKVINGKIVMTTPWIEYGQFAPAGPCDPNEVLVFDHFGADSGGNPIGGDTQCGLPGGGYRYYSGASYHNPYWANDIASLADPQYYGGTASSLTHAWYWNPPQPEPCIILIFTTETMDPNCTDPHDIFDPGNSVIEGVILDYGTLGAGAGYYYSPVCLNAIGGIQLPTLDPNTDFSDPFTGTTVAGGWLVIYASAFDSSTGEVTFATTAQPMLWSTELTGIGESTALQWDDDNPLDANHDPNTECYNYTYSVCNPSRPVILGGMIAFWAEPAGCVPSGGDVDGNGCIDDADLLAVLFDFGGSGGPADVNCDGVVDDADLLEVLFNFGLGC